MAINVGTLKAMLDDYPDSMPVYAVSTDGLTQPKLTEAFLDPECEKELSEEDRLGKFVLITCED